MSKARWIVNRTIADKYILEKQGMHTSNHENQTHVFDVISIPARAEVTLQCTAFTASHQPALSEEVQLQVQGKRILLCSILQL